jgi:ribosomal biogenesis protein LAS1
MQVFAWRLRRQDGLPLLLDSTADIVDVVLQDEKYELNHNTLRLLYATALSR